MAHVLCSTNQECEIDECVLDVPDDGAAMSTFDAATNPFDSCEPNTLWRAFKIIQTVGDTLGAAVVNLDRVRVGVKRLR